MRALAAAEGNWVILHYAEADSDRIAADTEMLSALGLQVQAAPLEIERDRAALRVPDGQEAAPVSLFYLSDAALGAERQGECARRVDVIRKQQQRMIAIHLDPVSTQGDIAVLLEKVPKLMSYSLAQKKYRLRLTKLVLEQIDSQGEPTIAVFDAQDSKTALLPRALLIEYAGKKYVVPADFLGLVSVGRGASCQICLDSTFVSRLHGCFRVSDEAFLYRDMSSNGSTLFHGHEEELLHDSEVTLPTVGTLRIGDVTLAFAVSL